jgi:hypothetical protein
MQSASDVHLLQTGELSDNSELTNCSYVGKLLVSGPDAAISVVDDQITQFMFGRPSDNTAFQTVIDNYRDAILSAARKLCLEPSDRVTFTGVWFHVDYDQQPWFEGYVIHVTSSDGIAHARPYDIEIFDHDRSDEGRFRIGEFAASSPSHLVDRLLAAAFGMAGDSSQSTSGLPKLQGVVWYPAADGDKAGLPIVVSKLVEITRSDRLPEDVEPLKADLGMAQQEFVDAHAEALASDAVSERLRAAFAALYDMSPKMKKWALRQLQFSKFGARDDQIVERKEIDRLIRLSDLANISQLDGYWFQVRNKDGIIQGSRFKRFDDDARIGLNDSRAIFKRKLDEDQTDEDLSCRLASDWHPTRTGASVRFLANGLDPRLSW